MGGMGQIGKVRWVSLGIDKPGFILSSHIFNRGDAFTYTKIFELGHGIRELASLMETSNDVDGCTPERDQCRDIEGAIRFDAPPADGYADMLVDFSGRIYRLSDAASDEQPVEHVVKEIRESARYRFDGKAYALVAGTNPIDM